MLNELLITYIRALIECECLSEFSGAGSGTIQGVVQTANVPASLNKRKRRKRKIS